MKGVIFTEFLDFVEDQMGAEMVDVIIDDCDLSTGGAYTAVSTYPFAELQQLVVALSKRTDADVPTLLHAFGRRMCGRFAAGHGQYFARAGNLFDLLASIDNHIHVEVRKLYPDAELPSFAISARDDGRLCLDYRSERALDDFALGLMEEAADFFREAVTISRERLSDADGPLVRFTIVRRAAQAA